LQIARFLGRDIEGILVNEEGKGRDLNYLPIVLPSKVSLGEVVRGKCYKITPYNIYVK